MWRRYTISKHFECNDSSPKIYEIEFDTGSLQKNDTWHLCESCSQKPEFLKFRLSITKKDPKK